MHKVRQTVQHAHFLGSYMMASISRGRNWYTHGSTYIVDVKQVRRPGGEGGGGHSGTEGAGML